MAKSAILIEDNSQPNLSAFVEADNGCVYLYLFRIREEVIVGKCWVLNTKRAPKKFDVRGMGRGKPPRLIAACCDHPRGTKPLGGLRLDWSDDGDTLTLYDVQGALAILTGVKGADEPQGFARHAIAASPVARPFAELPEEMRRKLYP